MCFLRSALTTILCVLLECFASYILKDELVDEGVSLKSSRTVGIIIGKLGVSKPDLSRRPSFVWLAERTKLTAGAEEGGFQTPRTRTTPSIWTGLHYYPEAL